MATKYASQRRKVAYGTQSCLVVVNRHNWEVEASTNGDKVIIGQLPANHRLVPELCTVQVDASAPAMNIDVCIDIDAQPIVDNLAITGSTYQRAALSAFAMCETVGVSPVNRDIYAILNTAPGSSAGNLIVTIASKPEA